MVRGDTSCRSTLSTPSKGKAPSPKYLHFSAPTGSLPARDRTSTMQVREALGPAGTNSSAGDSEAKNIAQTPDRTTTIMSSGAEPFCWSLLRDESSLPASSAVHRRGHDRFALRQKSAASFPADQEFQMLGISQSEHCLPRNAPIPSLAMMGTIARAPAGSAHQKSNRAFRTSPTRRIAER